MWSNKTFYYYSTLRRLKSDVCGVFLFRRCTVYCTVNHQFIFKKLHKSEKNVRINLQTIPATFLPKKTKLFYRRNELWVLKSNTVF